MKQQFQVMVLSGILLFSVYSFPLPGTADSYDGAIESAAASKQAEAARPADSAATEAPYDYAPALSETAPAASKATAAGPTSALDFKKLGDRYIKKGRTDKAMDAYRQCLERAGGDTAYSNIRLLLGKYYYGKKMYAEALPLLIDVSERDSKALPFKIMLAAVQVEAGSSDSAIALLEPVAGNKKIALASRKELFKILGKAYFTIKNYKMSGIWYGSYCAAGGVKTADIAYIIAGSQEKTALAKAKLAYEANVKKFPKDYRNYLRLGIINAKNRATLPAALAFLRKAAALNDSVPAIWFEIGKVNASLGKKADEREAYKTCLKGDPDNLEAKIRLGKALLDAGMSDEAIKYLEDAVRQAPGDIVPMAALSTAYLNTKNPKKAIDVLVKIKTAQPKDIEVRKQLVGAYRATNQDRKAIEEIKEALEIDRDADLLLAGGVLLAKQKNLDDAAALLEELVNGKAPENIDALMTLAGIKRELKKYDEAIELYKQISSIDPNCATALYERAELHIEENKVKWAETFYRRALVTDPQYALAEVGLAKVAMQYKDREACNEHLTKAKALAPGDPAVLKAIEVARRPKSPATPVSSNTTIENNRKERRK